LRGLLRRSNQSVALASALTIVVAAVVGYLIYGATPELLYPFWIALLLVPLIALTSLRQAAMQGLGRVVLGRVAETIALPLIFIGLVAAAALTLDNFTAGWATALQVVAASCAFGLGALLLRRSLPTQVRGAPGRDLRAARAQRQRQVDHAARHLGPGASHARPDPLGWP
jgi:O-antigen/teichoic acid export membrane protein